MKALPKLSVVTPSFNSKHTIRETIESVLKQSYPNYEHIVMDGGSKDGTLDILREYPHLLWVSEKDEGHYHAMNKGIQRATGHAVVILNSDDCFRDGAMLEVGKAFQAHPEWDGLFGDIVYVDSRGQEIFRRREACYDYDVLRFSGLCYIIHQTLFATKAAYERLGLYRHKDFKNCCDYEFILRLGREGCKVGHLPFFLVNYRYHQHGQSADLRITRNMAREGRLIQTEYGCPVGLTAHILKAAFRSKRQLQKLLHHGKADLIPGQWMIRRHMQSRTEFSSNIGLDKLEV